MKGKGLSILLGASPNEDAAEGESPKDALVSLLKALGLPTDGASDEQAKRVNMAIDNLAACCDAHEGDEDDEDE